MGVKSLWSLLTPVGRPIMLETVEGKTMAIDSSIWIYQFQATMRDKDGRGLVNAHVLGFLRRITKLLFYGIKPVFVFDGGAPALKRNTLNERRKKKSGAATSHVRLAEKLLAAKLRKEALDCAHGSRYVVLLSGKGKGKAADEEIVYLEDIDPSLSKTPALKTPTSAPSSEKKNKFRDHDPYRLPEVDLEAAVAKATRSVAPDPRLATEEELRTFIEEMRPEDFDITSPEFRELPTEVQYEIIGDLRLKSRQTSHARLEKMLRNSRTPMDFSKAQIQNLRQRNALTQQLLITTNSIGSAHISIPVRIASERNKEYVLIKNEGVSGGWILGIRDHGTQEKPIEIDQDNREENEDSNEDDMEEVDVSAPTPFGEDLCQFQREVTLQAVPRHHASNGPKRSTSKSKKIVSKSKSETLFVPDGDDDMIPQLTISDEDENLSFAIQASLDDIYIRQERDRTIVVSAKVQPSKSHTVSEDKYDDLFASPSRLDTVLSFANVSPLRSKRDREGASLFGQAPLLSTLPPSGTNPDPKLHVVMESGKPELTCPLDTPPQLELPYPPAGASTDSDEDMEEVVLHSNDFLKSGSSHIKDAIDDKSTEEHVILFSLSETVPQTTFTTQEEAQEGQSTPKSDLDQAETLEEEDLIPWSRSPSPSLRVTGEAVHEPISHESWDAAHEIDQQAEEGEFARFMSQVKGRDLDVVRREIDDEIESLNQQRKAAMRDAGDVTQHMVAQIMTMLRLFGIPYITAPMEAEAQCAELVSLGLVDGVITDDSDVFLFGAQRVFKNMFNQSKTVECFLLSDLSRELGLDRDTLIRLAYLLGSDYVEGLPGVGPVVAMELLKEFPGVDGLHKFKDWWTRVQSGKDTKEDNKSKFRQRFKKKFKSLYLEQDWPNPAVRDGYYHPAVDSSDEPFKWGLPDLDGLRQYFQEELGWRQSKVDELLLPIIQKINRRGQAANANKQSNLSEFFGVSSGMGSYAPKKRQAYSSKRLQQVVSDFRKRQRRGSLAHQSREGSYQSDSDSDRRPESSSSVKKRKTQQKERKARARTNNQTSKRGGKSKVIQRSRSKSETNSEDEEPSIGGGTNAIPTTPLAVQLRPRPRPIHKGIKVPSRDNVDKPCDEA
ncbi:hypothetical protein AMATHDRAFT_138725 [Amanita thiersii Skay4041]|uniref:PIN domain-like protein n=1 Tax=Amanita thiersii Skay4041 TaxID=703135 RepID=A0A2A9NYA0_9AGAR|nr:hypothetical protein AMATHDRAFT_138725 [Amanita thiersii Skay4041]